MKSLSGRQESEHLSSFDTRQESAHLSSLDTVCVTSARKRKRAFHRIMSGLHRDGRYRFLTLTSSPESPLDIQRSWRKFTMRLQRRGLLKDGYIRVTEYTHQGRPHYHIIFRGSYIEQRWLSHIWAIVHEAPIVYISDVRSKRGISGYLAKYMAKDNQGRLSWSMAWLYKGFVKAWYDLKRIGRELNLPRGQVLQYWQTCCRLGKIPLEVQLWRQRESYLKLPVKSAERHSAVPIELSLSRQLVLITTRFTQML